jgi:hypothetical protein
MVVGYLIAPRVHVGLSAMRAIPMGHLLQFLCLLIVLTAHLFADVVVNLMKREEVEGRKRFLVRKQRQH